MDKEHRQIDAKIVESRPIACGDKSLNLIDGKTNAYASGLLGSFESEEANQKRDFGGNRFNAPNIYRQDVVKSNKDNDMVGIVTEVGGDLDSESDTTDDEDDGEDEDEEHKYEDEEENDDDDDEEDDNDSGSENKRKGDDDKNDPLPTGQVRVIWMNQSETTQSLEEVTVIDRAFLHGDIVAASSDPMGQIGIVANVNIYVDLLDQDGSVIKDVSARDLKRVRDFTVGDHVVLGPWLGRVDDVLDNVTVLFDDGSMCKVMKVDPLRLKPISKCILEDGNFPYYPGQRVRASSSSVFKNGRWLSGSWKASRLEGMVTKVTVGSVFVYWIASAGHGFESTTAPAEEQGPKNLKLLSCLSHANWQVGDWCLLPSHISSSYISKDKNSSIITSEVPTNVKLVSGALEGEHISESVPMEKVDGNCPSFTSAEPMVLDIVDNLDKNSEKEKAHMSPESSPCSSSLSTSKEPLHENWHLRRKKMRKVVVRRDKKARKKEENFDRALLIVNTKTKVDVSWQDGKQELGLASRNLIPIDNPGDQEFLPEQYVVEKASDDNDDENACEAKRVGVVKSVNAEERTGCVRWLKSVSRPEDPREFDKEEIVSVYELELHPDYDYCYGDVVVRLSPVSVSSNVIGSVKPVEESGLCDDPNDAKKDSVTSFLDEKVEDSSTSGILAYFSDLSWVGNITGLKDGDIEVTWANGMVSTVGPQAIYVVGRDDDDEPSEYGSEISDGAASWETVDEDGMDTLENAEEEAGPQDGSSIISQPDTTVTSEDCNSGGHGALAIPLAALGFVTRLATGFFSRRRKQNDPLDSDHNTENVPQSPGIVCSTTSGVESSSQQTNTMDNDAIHAALDDSEGQGLISEVTEVDEPLRNLRSEETDAQCMLGCTGQELCSFKRFDTAKDPLDHFFLGANGQSSNGRKWLKKVHQDWGILQKNLPESIFVRVYEDRMDLLRAVIVGAYGTPYQDGLFIFDFHLPPEYPQCPPSAHYHSGGWRINPNLYEEGKVCLSLLNTWTGRGNEVWDPSSSSILQILVSLQGLVLNSKPYFNEAGYDKQVGTAEGEKNSLSYNENTFLLNCKSMMYLMRKPPKDFEELIKDHFRRRGYYILKACDAYMRSYLIGSLTKEASITEKSNENSTSVGFKLMLAKIMPKLISALSEVGADVHEFNHLLQS